MILEISREEQKQSFLLDSAPSVATVREEAFPGPTLV